MAGIILMILIGPLVGGYVFLNFGLPALIEMLPFLIGLVLGIILLRVILIVFFGMADSNNIFVRLFGLLGVVSFFVLLVSFCTYKKEPIPATEKQFISFLARPIDEYGVCQYMINRDHTLEEASGWNGKKYANTDNKLYSPDFKLLYLNEDVHGFELQITDENGKNPEVWTFTWRVNNKRKLKTVSSNDFTEIVKFKEQISKSNLSGDIMLEKK